MPTLPRVVVVLPSGLRKILGIFDPEKHQAKTTLEWDHEDGSKGCALLVSTSPRIILYRETYEPPPDTPIETDRPL